jgi:tRNA(fMet)-specific endonuclease VapC
MRWLLDTNAVIATLRDSVSALARRLRQVDPGEVALSAIVAHELFYGAFKSRRASHNVALVDALQFPVIEFDKEDARQAGEIRASLSARGTEIGPYDLLIASQAVARDLILVTHNTREFGRVPGLQIEDWEAR